MNKTILLAIFFCWFSLSFSQSPTTEATKKETKVETIHLTKKEFLKRVINYEKNPKEWIYLGDKPCLVDFYASWCGPCKRIAPILEELATEYKGKIYIYKVNTDEEKELSQAFGIVSLPTLIFCPMKGNPSMAKGALPKEDIVKLIEQQLLVKAQKKKEKKIK